MPMFTYIQLYTHTHTHDGVLFSLNKEILPLATWIDARVLSDIRQTQKDK